MTVVVEGEIMTRKITLSRTKDYKAWNAMVNRCTNPNNYAFKDYGGRGITVCPAWRKYSNFVRDMGPRPRGRTLDRIDNNKGYFKGNCRWATPSAQNKNRRNSAPDGKPFKKRNGVITIWVPLELKRRYSKIRLEKRRKFLKKLQRYIDHSLSS